MQKKSLKTLITLVGMGLLFSQSANAISLPGFGKQSRAERIASQLSGAPVGKALALKDEEHVNDWDSSKCFTIGRSGKNIETLVRMAANGCLPYGTQYSSIAKIRQDFCLENCTNGIKNKCDANDPQELKDLCERYCSKTNLGSPRAQKLMTKCFAEWGLTKPMSFEEAASYEGTAKSMAAAQKTETKQSAGEIKGYKVTVGKAVTALKVYFEALKKFEAEREKVVAATDALMKTMADVENEKAELIEGHISLSTLNNAEQKAIKAKSVLTAEQVEEVGALPATELELAAFRARFIGVLNAAVASIVELAKEAKSELGNDKFAGVSQEAQKQQRLRDMAKKARENTKKSKKARIADKAFEKMDGAKKASASTRNPMFRKKRS